MVWTDFTDDFDWTSFLSLITRVNNLFWDRTKFMNEFKIFDRKHNEKMIVHMSNLKTSFWQYMNNVQKDIHKYLETHDDFNQCSLVMLTKNSGFIIGIFDAVYGNFIKKKVSELLYAIADFDTTQIRTTDTTITIKSFSGNNHR